MKSLFQILFFSLLLSSSSLFSQSVECNPSSLASNWQLLGPKSDLVYNNIGRVTAIWVDSEDNNYILAGTRGSGLWRTLDGGTTWNNLTGYQLPATGIYSIDVKKVGVNRSIYCSTLFNGSSMNLHGLGLIYSDDDGLTWTRETTFPGGIAPFRLYGNLNDLGKRRLRFKPGSYELFIANGSQLFARNTNGVDTWNISVKADLNVHGNTTITDHAINEIDFHPTNPNIAIISPHFFFWNGG